MRLAAITTLTVRTKSMSEMPQGAVRTMALAGPCGDPDCASDGQNMMTLPEGLPIEGFSER
jgi:hypothetical protein